MRFGGGEQGASKSNIRVRAWAGSRPSADIWSHQLRQKIFLKEHEIAHIFYNLKIEEQQGFLASLHLAEKPSLQGCCRGGCHGECQRKPQLYPELGDRDRKSTLNQSCCFPHLAADCLTGREGERGGDLHSWSKQTKHSVVKPYILQQALVWLDFY